MGRQLTIINPAGPTTRIFSMTLEEAAQLHAKLSNKNHLIILWLLYRFGPMSPTEIAKVMDGTLVRINYFRMELESVGLVSRSSTEGKKGVKVSLNMEMLPHYIQTLNRIQEEFKQYEVKMKR